MHFQVLAIEEFTTYQKSHPLSNFYQTFNYALLMAENGFDYEFVGLVDDNNTILAASLILLKPIGTQSFYGYAPRGFLIDYQNTELVRIFSEEIKKYFYKKNVIFIKLNPNIKVSEINKDNYEPIYIDNENVLTTLNDNGYKKLANNLYFEAKLPRFNAFIDLNNFDSELLSKNTKNKIKKGIRKGLVFEKASKDKIGYFYNLIKDNLDNGEYYYQDYYTVFNKTNSIDYFLVKIDYFAFLQNSQYAYDKELERNNKLNNKLIENNNERIINAKMSSDKILLSYKNDIMEATKGIQDEKEEYIAGALVIKHNNMVSIVFSGYNKDYKRFVPNYFLHYNIIKYYQESNNYLDLNGVVGNFKQENSYTGLNRFKLGFNPKIYEFIGEFDLIIDSNRYDILLRKGILAEEFNKK